MVPQKCPVYCHWFTPHESDSHHQNYCILGRVSQPKPSFATGILGAPPKTKTPRAPPSVPACVKPWQMSKARPSVHLGPPTHLTRPLSPWIYSCWILMAIVLLPETNIAEAWKSTILMVFIRKGRRVVFPSKINIVFTDYFIMVARLLHCGFPWLVLQFEYD